MKNTYYFLRHAETKKDPTVPATLWGLSGLGNIQSKEVAESGLFNEVDLIVTSNEVKAQQTVGPLADKLGLTILVEANFREVERGEIFLTQEEFKKLKKDKLENLDCDLDSGETGRQALERFELGVEQLEKEYSNKKILIVSHGTILALYFAKIKNDFSDIFARWEAIKFCSFGIISNNKLIRDIV